MKPFIITFDDWLQDGSRDLAKLCRFIVTQGKQLRFPVNVAFSDTAACNLELWGDDSGKQADLQIVTLKIGLQRLIERLNRGDYPKQATINCEEIMISSVNAPSDASSFLRKNCKYHQQNINGPLCAIGNHGDNITTPQFCEKCAMPDESLMCSHLIHLKSESKKDHNDHLIGRDVRDAFCAKGESFNAGFDVMICQPEARPCWEKIYEIPQPVINIPVDLPDRVVDEIDFLNVYIKDAYKNGIKLIDLKFYRPISDVHGKCQTDKEFTTLVQVVGTIIEQFQIISLLPADKQTKKEGANDVKLKSIEALERFLQINYSASGDSVLKTLRHIIQIRNSYPAHIKEDIGSFEALGIEHPIADYQKAWDKILYAFYDSIKTLRKLIQT
jgi:hypothetical protein